MEQILHTNIFFFITSVSVIVLTVFCVMILIQVLRIVKNVESLSTKVKTEGEEIVADVSRLRTGVKKKAADIHKVVSAFGQEAKKLQRKRKL